MLKSGANTIWLNHKNVEYQIPTKKKKTINLSKQGKMTTEYKSEFLNRVVLITGGASGIGLEISRAFASHGANLSITYFSNDKGADHLKETFKKSDSEFLISKSNVCSESDTVEVVAKTVKKFGRIDILINNSAVHCDSMIWKMSSMDWNDVLNTNLTGPFIFTREVLPYMRQKNYGRIINIGSVVSQMGVIGAVNYAAAKAGLQGLTRSTALEVANKHITVNSIALGYIDMGMTHKLKPELQKQVLNKIPMKRFGKKEELIHTVFFLAAQNAGYITGQTIHLNGGIYFGS